MTWKCVNNRFYYFKILKLKKAHWDDFGHNSLYKKSFNQVRIVGLICIREVQPAIPVQLLTIYSGWALINLKSMASFREHSFRRIPILNSNYLQNNLKKIKYRKKRLWTLISGLGF